MATIKLILDTRKTKENAPVRISIAHRCKTVYTTLDVRLNANQWNSATQKVVSHPQKVFLNSFLNDRLAEYNRAMLTLSEKVRLSSLTAIELRDRIEDIIYGRETQRNTIEEGFLSRLNNIKAKNSKILYHSVYSFFKKNIKDFDKLTYDDINKAWLVNAESIMVNAGLRVNSRLVYFSKLKAVFNEAIDNELTSNYPFRKFQLKREATRKRSLTVEQLRYLFSIQETPRRQRYLDIFKLMFFLCGINTVDLMNLKEITNGRAEYRRAKTGKLYSIKVEPEAMEIIDKYRATDRLIDMDQTDPTQFNIRMRMFFKTHFQGDPVLSKVSSYWSRHSFATIAAELDIPKETISAALGHSSGNPITNIYINFDERKIDEANRKVIDYVLYNKK